MKRNFVIIGAGLSGCAIARLLADRGHSVRLLERETEVGGLCLTRISPNGFQYEPFGARTFHTRNRLVRRFVTRFGSFNRYAHRKGVMIGGKLLPFPLTPSALDELPESARIRAELARRPAVVDMTNFETACLSVFGPTLYGLFIANYTARMWGTEPRTLTAEWAPRRLEWGADDDNLLFKDQWQGLPEEGYSALLARMIRGIPLSLQVVATMEWARQADVVIATAPLDAMFDYRFGRLPYRSLRFNHRRDEPWPHPHYGTINLPEHTRFVRRCNFKIMYQQEDRPGNWIQYQEPCAADDRYAPMYPVQTPASEEQYTRYLDLACRARNLCPLGRLGLFKYLDMDAAVALAMRTVPLIETYHKLNRTERFQRLMALRNQA
jgi:UDP-galactopyranose mutase